MILPLAQKETSAMTDKNTISEYIRLSPAAKRHLKDLVRKARRAGHTDATLKSVASAIILSNTEPPKVDGEKHDLPVNR